MGFNPHIYLNNSRVEIILAFADCSPKIGNKGYDVFDTPALALSHPLHNSDAAIDQEEKTSQSTPDIVQDARQDIEDKVQEVIPQRILQAKVNHDPALNPIGNYRVSASFERSFIDLGKLMVEEGFDLSTYTQLQDLLSNDWKLA